MPVVSCHFTDGASFEVDADSGESFLEIALRHGVPIRNQCRSGTCLSCLGKCAVGSGPLSPRPGRPSSLLPIDKKQGKALCCVSEVTSEGDIYFDYPSDEAGPSEAKCFIDSIEWIASDAVKLTVELADGDWLDFRSGQYVEIAVPDSSQCRSYSMCTAPNDLPQLAFMVRILAGGLMSEYLTTIAKPDDVLTLRGPFGGFAWSGSRSAPQLFIAGGTGLSPICSILHEIRNVAGAKPPMTLSLGCATPEALLAPGYLRLLESWMPTLSLRLSAEFGDVEGAVMRGNALTAIDFSVVTPQTEAYVCGPEGLINAATKKLVEVGVPATNIYYERFVASGAT